MTNNNNFKKGGTFVSLCKCIRLLAENKNLFVINPIINDIRCPLRDLCNIYIDSKLTRNSIDHFTAHIVTQTL